MAHGSPGSVSTSLATRRAHVVPYVSTAENLNPCGLPVSSTRSSRPHHGTFTLEDTTTRGFMVVGISPATPGLYEIVANCYGVSVSLLRSEEH